MGFGWISEWTFWVLVLSLVAPVAVNAQSTVPGSVQVHAQSELDRLLRQTDADGDKRITVDDLHHPNSTRTKSQFWLQDLKKRRLEVSGTFYLANLLQELKLASELGSASKAQTILGERIFENPVARITRSIREIYWNGLTRRVDAEHLAQVLPDSKLPKSEWKHLYVPHGDPEAYAYFENAAREKPDLKLKVWRLPENLNEAGLQQLNGRHGVLALALEKDAKGTLRGVPFVVPGGRFNEMYGWDSYFEALGLLADGRTDLAKAMVDNFIYQIRHYGKILNANRSYYLNRSQPPFLTSMISAVYERMEKTPANKTWLKSAIEAALKEYFDVWMNSERLTETGLSRYFGSGKGIPPEVEKGHFDFILKPAARKHRLSLSELIRRYNSGELKDPELDEFFSHDRAVRESGHDTTYRWRVGSKDRAGDFVTVDLNALLYKYEIDFARIIQAEFGGAFAADSRVTKSGEWSERAKKRRDLMLKFLWDPTKKIFFDYNFKDKARSDYVSATAFYPLWAQNPADPSTRILDDKEAALSVQALLKELEAAGGLSSTSQNSRAAYGDPRQLRQWDFPNGWAPHQMIAWEGLRHYGLTAIADRLTYKWLYTIARNAADYNGTVPEKFDVVKRSHAVFAEYGNVGTDFSYITKEGFGWMNASFQVGLKQLSEKWRSRLELLQPPEWIEPFSSAAEKL